MNHHNAEAAASTGQALINVGGRYVTYSEVAESPELQRAAIEGAILEIEASLTTLRDIGAVDKHGELQKLESAVVECEHLVHD